MSRGLRTVKTLNALGSKEASMDDKERQEWSQHYDKLQWAVITITSAGIGTLIAASFNTANIDQLWPEFSGLALTILGAAYVASFRTFRNRLHQAILDKQMFVFLNGPGNAKWFTQWNLFMVSFLVVDIAFLYRLTQKGLYPCIVGWILFLGMIFILGAIWWKGAAGGRVCRSKEQKNVTDSTRSQTV